MKKITFSVLFILSGIWAVQAQSLSPCSTPNPEKILQFDHNAINAVQERDGGGAMFIVQIFVHILRNSDGTSPAINQTDLENNLHNMANFFQPHGICFVLVGQDFIDNTTWRNELTSTMSKDLFAVKAHANAIDIYVIAGGINLAGGIPGGEFTVSTGSPHNFPHEMGHCLGLLHTFHNDNNPECPSGSNCATAGDLVCDTPADFYGSFDFQQNCIYTGTKMMNCGIFNIPVAYNPSTNNAMSYFAGCYTQFTPGQGERMRNTILFTPSLMLCLAPVDRVVSNTVITNEVAYGAQQSITIGKINLLPGNVTIQANGHGMFSAGSRIEVLPGTSIAPTGSRGVILRINDLCSDGSGGISGNGDDRREEVAAPSTSIAAGSINVSPNPFTFSTTITYTLSAAQAVDVQIFNIIGNLVAQPVRQQQQDAGQYEYTFDASDLPTGGYLLVMDIDGQKLTKRLVLTR